MSVLRPDIAGVELKSIIEMLDKADELVRRQSWITPEIEVIVHKHFQALIDTLDMLLEIRLGVEYTRKRMNDELECDFGLSTIRAPDPVYFWDYDEAVMEFHELRYATGKMRKQIDEMKWGNFQMGMVLHFHLELFDCVVRRLFQIREADQDGVKN